MVNPDCCRKATALALRPPILQWTTISRLESSSLTRLGRSFERNQMSADVADLVFVRLAHVEHEEILFRIETPLQFFDLNFRNA